MSNSDTPTRPTRRTRPTLRHSTLRHAQTRHTHLNCPTTLRHRSDTGQTPPTPSTPVSIDTAPTLLRHCSDISDTSDTQTHQGSILLQRERRERVQRDAEGAPGAAQNDHKRRVERARAQSAAEGLLLPAEHGSRPVSAQGLRRRGRAIAQADRQSAQGGGAAGEEGESSVGAARAAADDRTACGGRGGRGRGRGAQRWPTLSVIYDMHDQSVERGESSSQRQAQGAFFTPSSFSSLCWLPTTTPSQKKCINPQLSPQSPPR